MTILVADIGGTAFKIGLVNLNGQLTEYHEYENDGKKGGPALMARLLDILDSFDNFTAIGISTSGQVDSGKGEIIFANDNIPNYTGTKLQKILEQRYAVPVKVENDVNAAALGEAHYGAGKQFQDFICLTYGTGIGGAIIMNSQIYKGLNGSAGEFGHFIVHPGGESCKCGNSGCYESYASTTALLKKANQISPTWSNGKALFEQYHQQNASIITIVDEWINEITIGIISLVHIFNPPAIIVGGGIMEQKQLVNQIEKKVQTLIMPSFTGVKIMQASLGNKAGLYGAAALHLINQKNEGGV